MVTLELPDEDTLYSLIADRRAKGLDKPDEVWDGRYIVMPNPGNEHQDILFELSLAFGELIKRRGLGRVLPGCNVSDREDDWRQNYRCPDVAVFLNTNPAEDRGSHWLGGPDLAVEIISRGDRARQKLDFYAAVGVRELILIERDPWVIDLFSRDDEALKQVATATPGRGRLETNVVPLSWSLTLANGDRPRLHLEGAAQEWTA